jgi:alpha-glucosidase
MAGRTSVRVLSALGLAILTSFFQSSVEGTTVDPKVLDSCPGYSATNVKNNGPRLTADLVLNGKGCNVFGADIQKLTLNVVYETGELMVARTAICPSC